MESPAVFAHHTLLELMGCPAHLLAGSAHVRAVMLDAVQQASGTIVAELFHEFSPHGASGVIVIAESHVAIHTWPEHGYAAVDIFSCSPKLDAALLRQLLETGLGATTSDARVITRGPNKLLP